MIIGRIVIASLVALALSGCSDGAVKSNDAAQCGQTAEYTTSSKTNMDGERFELEVTNLRFTYVLTDHETGCQYLVNTLPKRSWSVPLFDSDGKPLRVSEEG